MSVDRVPPGPAPVFVLAPAPLLTITIEDRGDRPDVHLHAGGQGVWLARMITALGVPVTLCGAFGGETGAVLRVLIEREHIGCSPVDMGAENVAYVHDRRSGVRQPVADMPAAVLSRHEVDALYGAALAGGLDAQVCVLGGPSGAATVPEDFYRRLAGDFRANRKTVVADLSGSVLTAALAGGLDVLKVSDEELVADGRAESVEEPAVVAAMSLLRATGAEVVVVSRAARPLLVGSDDGLFTVSSPHVKPLDVRGAGDALTGGIAAGLARAAPLDEAVRLGAAAATLNVARRGLATGRRQDIEGVTRHIQIRRRASEAVWA